MHICLLSPDDDQQGVKALACQTGRDIRSGEGIAPARVPQSASVGAAKHSGELKTGTGEAIKKQLGLK